MHLGNAAVRAELFKSYPLFLYVDFCFITEEDIKEFGSMKIDKQFLSLLTIVRHCAKIKQVRSGRVTKFLLLA